MKITVFSFLLLLSVTIPQLFSQTQRFASKATLLELSWAGSTPSRAQQPQSGLQILGDRSLNFVAYSQGFEFTPNTNQSTFNQEYLKPTTFQDLHWDGTFTVESGPQVLSIVGSRNVRCVGSWSRNGFQHTAELTGTLITQPNGQLQVDLTGNFLLDPLGFTPSTRAVLDLPQSTQVRITGSLPKL
jgi:hypothetical protein